MTPLRVSIIFDAMADGANISQACARAGVHPSTYCKWAIRNGRRSYPRPKLPTLWAKGITRRDRLFLWYLAYRLPGGYALTLELLQEPANVADTLRTASGHSARLPVVKLVEKLAPGRLSEVLKAVDDVDVEPKAMRLLQAKVQRELADKIIATAVKLPKKVGPKRRQAKRTSRKSEG